MHRTRLVAAVTAALTLGALAAASAPAATTALGGSPLNVYVGDQGQLQAFRAGESSGLYYYPFNHEGDAGFFLAMRDGVTPPVYGFDGSAGPHGLTDYTLVSQTTTYVNGTQQFTVRWDVQNASGGTVHFKALAAADFFFEGSDRGTGIFTQGPPRFIGGTNADTGRSGGFAEILGPPINSPATASRPL